MMGLARRDTDAVSNGRRWKLQPQVLADNRIFIDASLFIDIYPCGLFIWGRIDTDENKGLLQTVCFQDPVRARA
jgi:hypothetical protein